MFVQNRLYFGREDGVERSTDAFFVQQRAHGAPTEIADVVLSTGAQHATRGDLQAGVERAHALLRENGKLVIRGLMQPDDEELGFQEILCWALESGFDDRRAVCFRTEIDPMVNLVSRAKYSSRDVETIVLEKH